MHIRGKRKYDIFKTYYYDDAIKIGKHELPLLKPVKFIPDDVISFNEKSKLKPNDNRWLDFFIDDALFECVWNNVDKYKRIFKKAKGIITTDYSVYPELHPDQIRKFNKNRIPEYDIDYGIHNGIKFLHVHYYKDGIRSKKPVELKQGDKLYEKYKHAFKGVK